MTQLILPADPTFDLLAPRGLMTPRAFVRAILDADTRVGDYGIETWAAEYAEPGYEKPTAGILFGNWNDRGLYNSPHRDRRPSRFAKIAEYAGYECEWYDEWSTCDDCGKAIRTSPDSYAWTPSYAIVRECTLLCHECLLNDIEAYLADLIGESNRVMPESIARRINLEDYGFAQVNSDAYESGFHPGQDDTGPKVVKALRDSGVITDDTEWLFVQDEQSQFYIRFSIWTRNREA